MCAESQDTARPTAPRWGLRVAIGLGVVAVVALAFLAARWVGQRSSLSLQAWFYTDADTIKEPAADAPLRDILWQPARPLPWEVINTTDVFQVLPPTFGTSVPPTSPRFDLFPDGVINTTDLFRVLPPFLGSSCAP